MASLDEQAGEPTGVERLFIITHAGVRIVLLDFRGATDPQQIVAQIQAIRTWFARQPPTRQLRTLTDVTGARYNSEVLEALKALAAHNKPYVGPAAAVVQTALHRLALNIAGMFSGRKFRAFSTREDAREWLARQEGEAGKQAG